MQLRTTQASKLALLYILFSIKGLFTYYIISLDSWTMSWNLFSYSTLDVCSWNE